MDVKKARFLIALLLLLFHSSESFAQSAEDIRRAERINNSVIQLQQQRKKAEQEQRERQRPRTSYELKQPPKSHQTVDAPNALCFPIQDIQIKGATLLSAKQVKALSKPYSNQCLSLAKINQLIKAITLKYVELGYVTTRAYIPKQDLSKGILKLQVIEGIIESFDTDQAPTKYLGNIFPKAVDYVLNLRDIEQGIEQINRLASNQASMNLLPGKAIGASIIQLKNVVGKTWLGQMSIDNSGQQSTGKTQGKLFFSKDDLFNINDYSSISLLHNVGNSTNRSRNVALHYDAPYGYWLFSLDSNWSDYRNQVDGASTTFESSGDSTSQTLKAQYVWLRNQTQKTQTSMQLDTKTSNNYIEGVLLDTSSRTLSLLTLSLNQQRFYSGRRTLQWSIAYKRGLPYFGAKESTEGDSEELEYNALSASVNFSTPVTINQRPFMYATQWSMQSSNDQLYASEQFSIGSQYTVRGFKVDSVSGPKGMYWRNDLSYPIALSNAYLHSMTPYLAVDVGLVKPSDTQQTRQLSGAAVGIKLKGKKISAELGVSQALNRPSSFNDDKTHYQFSLSYTF